jgi:ornithine cyclodeaminase/alanine dehydrogenase-like protein (mu-crystallin family)
VVELSAIVSGRHAGRTDDWQITLFKSNGIALEDVAVATLVYRKAVAAHVGTDIAMWQS